FSLQPSQGSVRAVFVPLKRLQQDLEIAGRVNAMLVSGQFPAKPHGLQNDLRRAFALEDVGLTVRVVAVSSAIAVESAAGLLDASRVKAIDVVAAEHSVQTQPVFTYLANTIRSGDRQVPYSLVTAIDLNTVIGDGGAEKAALRQSGGAGSSSPIVLNDWTAR